MEQETLEELRERLEDMDKMEIAEEFNFACRELGYSAEDKKRLGVYVEVLDEKLDSPVSIREFYETFREVARKTRGEEPLPFDEIIG